MLHRTRKRATFNKTKSALIVSFPDRPDRKIAFSTITGKTELWKFGLRMKLMDSLAASARPDGGYDTKLFEETLARYTK